MFHRLSDLYNGVTEKFDSVAVDVYDDIQAMRYPIDESLMTLGKRWGAPILLEIISGRNSFNELLRAIPGLSAKTLSVRIAEYERFGLIARERAGDSSPRTCYVLTRKGQEMRDLIRDMVGFSMRWQRMMHPRMGGNAGD